MRTRKEVEDLEEQASQNGTGRMAQIIREKLSLEILLDIRYLLEKLTNKEG